MKKSSFREEYKSIVRIKDDFASSESLELVEFLQGKSFEEFVQQAYKSYWLWMYIVNHSKYTLEKYTELKAKLLDAAGVVPVFDDDWETENEFIILPEERMQLLMNEFFNERKTNNFLAFFHLQKGSKEREKFHTISLPLIREWIQNYG